MTGRSAYDDQSVPPVPVPGCPVCAGLASRRDEARARRDGSAETDAAVLLRRHQRQEHGGASVRDAVMEPPGG
ncbi:hypothetical protein [Streptomyces sp. NPDC001020]